MDNKINDFKAELKELLKKYNMMIGFECDYDSDLHGVYGEKISVVSCDSPLEPILSVNGFWLSNEDI